MSVISSKKILELMDDVATPDISKRLIITPLLEPIKIIDPISIDLRLGHQFIIFQHHSFPHLDIASEDYDENVNKYQKRLVRGHAEGITIHPGQYIIGSTLEYIQIPLGVMGYVIGKSTWGRMGLIIATATKVDPGFKGCVTLEIVNDGEVPLVLYPGVPIAQFVLHKSDDPVQIESSSYRYAIGPQFPKFKRKDWKYWTEKNDNS